MTNKRPKKQRKNTKILSPNWGLNNFDREAAAVKLTDHPIIQRMLS
jgi:hypothetical protein